MVEKLKIENIDGDFCFEITKNNSLKVLISEPCASQIEHFLKDEIKRITINGVTKSCKYIDSCDEHFIFKLIEIE
ncbi:hypothetical protein CCO90_000282 [Escherichia coli]|nr:hypothetical protein [Escherichia coli]